MAVFAKLGDFKGDIKEGLGNVKSNGGMSPAVKSKLQQAGLSQAGISSLSAGRPLNNKSDVAIVGSILGHVLK